MAEYRILISAADDTETFEVDTVVRDVGTRLEALDELLLRTPEPDAIAYCTVDDGNEISGPVFAEQFISPSIKLPRSFEDIKMFRALILWLLGVPLGIIILLYFFVF